MNKKKKKKEEHVFTCSLVIYKKVIKPSLTPVQIPTRDFNKNAYVAYAN